MTVTKTLLCFAVLTIASIAAMGQAVDNPSFTQGDLNKALQSRTIQVDATSLRFEQILRPLGARTPDEVRVQYQVGTADGKDAFLEFAVPAAMASTIDRQLREAITPLEKDGKRPLLGGSIIALCTGERTCVKTCQAANGTKFCCRWECKK